MAQNNAVIRPYAHDDDDKLVRFMVAKAALESLAIANNKAIFHPFTVSLWVAVSSIFVQALNWWPDPRYGILGYLRPVPAFAAWSLPFIFFIDWYQRPWFEKRSTEILKRTDMTNVEKYYSQTLSSGFWIYEFGDNFVGLAAVDTSADAFPDGTPRTMQELDTNNADSKSKSKSKIRKVEEGNTAVIRHLYVAEPYRLASAQDDLIEFVVKRVFNTSSNAERISVVPSPLSHYLERSLRKLGFEVVEQGVKVGILGWTTLVYELSRQKWEGLQKIRL